MRLIERLIDRYPATVGGTVFVLASIAPTLDTLWS